MKKSLFRASLTAFGLVILSGCSGHSSAPVTPPPPAPKIQSFKAEKGTIAPGETETLTPVFSNGTGIINGVGMVDSGMQVRVMPAEDTVYTLTVTNPEGVSVFTSVMVKVVTPLHPSPIQAPLQVSPGLTYTASIAPQAGCSYLWMVSNATVDGPTSDSVIRFIPGSTGVVTLYCTVANQQLSATSTATCPIVPSVISTFPSSPIQAPLQVSPGLTYTASIAPQAGCSYLWMVSNATVDGPTSDSIIRFIPGSTGVVTLYCTVTNQQLSATATATCPIVPTAR